MACIKITCWGELWEKIKELEMKKEVMGKIERTKGKDMKGGSTSARMKEAKALERKETKVGEKNETNPKNKVNKVVGKHAKIKG